MSVSFNLDSFINQADSILKSKEPANSKHEKLSKLFLDNAAALKKLGSDKLTSEQSKIFREAHSLSIWKPGTAKVDIDPNISKRDAAQAELRTRNFTKKKDN